MVNSDNLGYTTRVLSTIKSITECKKILVYNRNNFANDPDSNYVRLTLYNLEQIYNDVLVVGSGYDDRCCEITREIVDKEDITNNPFHYDCSNINTPNGFNIIIYLSNVDDSPVGFTEFINTQGRVSENIDIYLKFNINGLILDLHMSNELYSKRSLMTGDFLGTELNKYTSNFVIDKDIKNILKDSKYTTHLSSYLCENNKNNIYLNDRILNSDKEIIKLNLKNNYDFGLGPEFEKQQLTYYRDDIVVYSWKMNGNEVKYQIVSAISGNSYIYDEFADTIHVLDSKVKKQEVLYCAGKYIVIKITYRNKTRIRLFDTENMCWVDTKEDNVIVDPFDREAEIYELPRSVSISTKDSAYFLLPELVNVYLDLGDYISTYSELEVFRKIGDWIIIKNRRPGKDFYIATNMFSVIYMTKDDYDNMIVINNSTLLLKENTYYVVYYGVRKKTYYTERARSLSTGIGLTANENNIQLCNDDELEYYTELYNKKEICIVIKDSDLFSSIFDQFRKRPVSKLIVPSNIVGAIGGIIYYKENNKLSYI